MTKKQYRFVTGPAPRKEIWLLYGEPRYNERLSITIPSHYFWKIMLECGHTYLAPHRILTLGDYITSGNKRLEPPELEKDWVFCGRCAPVTKVEVKPEPAPKHRHYNTCTECKKHICCGNRHTKDCMVGLRERVSDAVIEYDYENTSLTSAFDKLLSMLTREQLEEVLR